MTYPGSFGTLCPPCGMIYRVIRLPYLWYWPSFVQPFSHISSLSIYIVQFSPTSFEFSPLSKKYLNFYVFSDHLKFSQIFLNCELVSFQHFNLWVHSFRVVQYWQDVWQNFTAFIPNIQKISIPCMFGTTILEFERFFHFLFLQFIRSFVNYNW